MLPSMGIFIIMLGPKMYMVDLDNGEMFYKFILSLVLVKYFGVDLGYYLVHKKDHQVTPLWVRCVCPMMDMVLYPYSSM